MPLSEIKIVAKDVLRGVRYLIRHSSGPQLPPPLPALGTLTEIGDTLVHRLADTVGGRPGGDTAAHRIEAAAVDLAKLAGRRRDEDFVERFHSATYALAKEVLALDGVGNALVSEYAFASAARAAPLARPETDPARFAAAVALAIAAAAPITLIDRPLACADDASRRSPNTAMAAAIGLAMTAWMRKRDAVGAAECLESAVEMVAPLDARIAAAISAPEPLPTLAALFDDYARFVP